MRKRIIILAATVVVAIGASGCGDSDSEGPAGGYDEAGFPLNENGKVSKNPDDYHETLCDTDLYRDDPSC